MAHQPFGGKITETSSSPSGFRLIFGKFTRHRVMVEDALTAPSTMQPHCNMTIQQHQRRE